MVYASTITVAANTLEGDATRTVLPVTNGVVWLIEVDFPPGCMGLAHVQLFDGKYQLAPASMDESFHGDNVTYSFDDLYLKHSAPFEFVVKTWNLDEVWPHGIQVRVGMASTEAFMSRYMPSVSWEKFGELMARAAVEQERVRQEQLTSMLKLLES